MRETERQRDRHNGSFWTVVSRESNEMHIFQRKHFQISSLSLVFISIFLKNLRKKKERRNRNLSDRIFDGVFGWGFHCDFSDAITCLEFTIFAHSSILHWQLLRCYVPGGSVFIQNFQLISTTNRWFQYENTEFKNNISSFNPNNNVPQKGLCRFGRSSKHKLALSSMSQKWAHHSIHSQIPPGNIDEHLPKFKTKSKIRNRSLINHNIDNYSSMKDLFGNEFWVVILEDLKGMFGCLS